MDVNVLKDVFWTVFASVFVASGVLYIIGYFAALGLSTLRVAE